METVFYSYYVNPRTFRSVAIENTDKRASLRDVHLVYRGSQTCFRKASRETPRAARQSRQVANQGPGNSRSGPGSVWAPPAVRTLASRVQRSPAGALADERTPILVRGADKSPGRRKKPRGAVIFHWGPRNPFGGPPRVARGTAPMPSFSVGGVISQTDEEN